MFRQLRILLLLLVLLFVAVSTWYARASTTDWDETLYVAVYPINGDGSDAARKQIAALDKQHFDDIERFLAQQAIRYTQTRVKPIEIEIAPEVKELPPVLDRRGNFLQTGWWSLKLRWWASKNDTAEIRPDIKVYLLYYDAEEYAVLDHSVGLEKGLVTVVKAFTGRKNITRNNVIIAHELLHTVGATDKYNPGNNLPAFPNGYADPDQSPLYPQKRAEIMGGRIPLSASKAEQPDSLRETTVGPATAIEIGWIK
jgi:hypothetical protein